MGAKAAPNFCFLRLVRTSTAVRRREADKAVHSEQSSPGSSGFCNATPARVYIHSGPFQEAFDILVFMKSYFKVVKNGEAVVRKISNNKKAYKFITKDISPSVSLARIETDKFEGEIEITQNFIYYVLEGQLTLKFGDEEVVLNPNDSCFVPKDSTYIMRGTFKVIVVSQPAFGT